MALLHACRDMHNNTTSRIFSALCIWSLLFRSGVAKDVRVKDFFEAWVLVEGLCSDEKTSPC